MYCIIYRSYFGDVKYLSFFNVDEEIKYGYFLTDKNTFMMNLSNNKKEHPTLFKTAEEAEEFIRYLRSVRSSFSCLHLDYARFHESLPTCDMECFKCNKKHKFNCKHLRNPYQNLCGFIMARFDDNFKPEAGRLDAPCDACLTRGCIFNQNYNI